MLLQTMRNITDDFTRDNSTCLKIIALLLFFWLNIAFILREVFKNNLKFQVILKLISFFVIIIHP